MKRVSRAIRYSAIGVFFSGLVSVLAGCTAREGTLFAALLFLLNFCSVPTPDGDNGQNILNLPPGFVYFADIFSNSDILACDPLDCDNTLVTINDGSAGTGMTFINDILYWFGDGGAFGGSGSASGLFCDPESCGTPTALAGLPVGLGITSIGTTLFGATQEAIHSCDVNNCAGTVSLVVDLTGQTPTDIISDGVTNIYWTDLVSGNLQTCDVTACTPSTIASNAHIGMTLSGSTLYWSGGNDIQSCDVSNCVGTLTTVIALADDATGIDFRSGLLYWGDEDGNLNACDPADCLNTRNVLTTAPDFVGDVVFGP